MSKCADAGLSSLWCKLSAEYGVSQMASVIQPKIGVYNETVLKQLDKVVATAAQYGIRLIVTLVNNWEDLGGMQWYVDQVGILLLFQSQFGANHAFTCTLHLFVGTTVLCQRRSCSLIDRPHMCLHEAEIKPELLSFSPCQIGGHPPAVPEPILAPIMHLHVHLHLFVVHCVVSTEIMLPHRPSSHVPHEAEIKPELLSFHHVNWCELVQTKATSKESGNMQLPQLAAN
eukprot:jgi/Botrbrau1/1438/Bobra.0063s0129.1